MTITTEELISKIRKHEEDDKNHPWDLYKDQFSFDPKETLEIIEYYPRAVLDLPDSLRDSEEFINLLSKFRIDSLHYDSYDDETLEFIDKYTGLEVATDRLKNNYDFICNHLSEYSDEIKFVDYSLKQNVDFIKKCLIDYGVDIESFPDDIVLDSQFAEENLGKILGLARFIDKNKLSDKEFLLSNIKKNCYLLYYSTEEIKNDPELTTQLALKNNHIFEFIGDKLKNDIDFLTNLLTVTKEDYFNDDFLSPMISKAFSKDLQLLIETSSTYHPWIKQDLPDFLNDVSSAKKAGLDLQFNIDFYKQLEYHNLSSELNNNSKPTKKMKL